MQGTFIVTGAGRGLGLELVRQLIGFGVDVIATVRSRSSVAALEDLVADVRLLDIAQPASVQSFAARLEGRPIDGLINNAALGGGLEQHDQERMLDYFNVNAMGPLRLARALLPNLRAGDRKLIVNITSKMGSIEANESGGSYGYRASKAALNMITKNLSIELADEGFTCLVIHPGWVQTDMGGPNAPLSSEESITSVLGVIMNANPEFNGRFFNYDGTSLPW